MGWSLGYDHKYNRDIGYGVPGQCDYPGCEKEIDRGLGYVCGSEPYGGMEGCGLYFCDEHLTISSRERNPQLCERCINNEAPFSPSPDTKEWEWHKLTHDSWERWRKENPEQVEEMKSRQTARLFPDSLIKKATEITIREHILLLFCKKQYHYSVPDHSWVVYKKLNDKIYLISTS